MGRDWLLPLYDPFTSVLGLNRLRRELIAQSNLEPSHRVLDIGCGTGTLAILIKRLCPSVEVVGVDPDDRALARARSKAARAGVAIRFDRGFADGLDYPTASFDRAFSSFMFHHLDDDDKPGMLREVRRVLNGGGSLHLMDFVGPARGRLRSNTDLAIRSLMTDAGFAEASRIGERKLAGGLLHVARYRASRSVA